MSKESATGATRSDSLLTEGYDRALELLHECATSDGFLASPTRKANYRRIWGRDGGMLTLAGLLNRDPALLTASKQTFLTLAQYQGPHGEIPSNVDTVSKRVSYGGTAGRVDADLWFVIGCGEYWKASGDDTFLQQIFPAITKVEFLLGAWEYNNRGLLYVPLTGDWADEYVHNGYVLSDQLLYLQALRTFAAMHTAMHGATDHALHERISRLRHLIRANYWFEGDDKLPDDVYHEVLYRKGRKAAEHSGGKHWMSYFSPVGYGYRFDSFAHVLVSLLDVADEQQREMVDEFIVEKILPKELPLLPAFFPIIKPRDEDWKGLQMTYSYTFRNMPYEYQNGGLWPMITGFYVAALARHGKSELAERCLRAVHQANALPMDGQPWSFPEFVHGKKLTAGGTHLQGWSAGAAVIGHHALRGESVFRINGNE